MGEPATNLNTGNGNVALIGFVEDKQFVVKLKQFTSSMKEALDLLHKLGCSAGFHAASTKNATNVNLLLAAMPVKFRAMAREWFKTYWPLTDRKNVTVTLDGESVMVEKGLKFSEEALAKFPDLRMAYGLAYGKPLYEWKKDKDEANKKAKTPVEIAAACIKSLDTLITKFEEADMDTVVIQALKAAKTLAQKNLASSNTDNGE